MAKVLLNKADIFRAVVKGKASGTPKSAKPQAVKPSAKPTNGNGKTPPTEYRQIMQITAKPLDERPTLAIGRNGSKVAPRRFHLLPDEIAQLKDDFKKTKVVPLPFNQGAYFFFCAALRELGSNKPHAFKTAKAQMQILMSAAETKDENGKSAWQRFSNKEAHTDNEENALKVDGRIKQNAEVLQRLGGLTPYGLKLQQIGQVIGSKGVVIDILKAKDGTPMYRLNTNSAEPLNEFRKRRAAK